MPELALNVPQHIIDHINARLNHINGLPPGTVRSANDIGRDAIAVYKWVVDQTEGGLAVVAANSEGKPILQITTPNIPGRRPSR